MIGAECQHMHALGCKRCGIVACDYRQQVKLSQYRAAAGAGGDSGGEQEHEKIARALLSNTDKEIIFDGLKKLYRKKARNEFVLVNVLISEVCTHTTIYTYLGSAARFFLLRSRGWQAQAMSAVIFAPDALTSAVLAQRFMRSASLRTVPCRVLGWMRRKTESHCWIGSSYCRAWDGRVARGQSAQYKSVSARWSTACEALPNLNPDAGNPSPRTENRMHTRTHSVV